MTIKKHLKNLPIPQLDAEVLLSFVLKKDKAWLYAHGQEELSPEQVTNFDALVKRRQQHEPVAYLIGKKEFYGRNFIVSPAVLIPRPASELIIERLLADYNVNEQLTIIDVGTGSGCLAVTAALEFPENNVYAFDISEAALEIAQKNIVKNVTIHQSDLLEYAIINKIQANIIIANLPYLTKEDLNQPDLSFEPADALLASDNGLAAIKRCTEQSLGVLNKDGRLYLEMNPGQIPLFTNWLKNKQLPFTIQVHQDLAGCKRILTLKKE